VDIYVIVFGVGAMISLFFAYQQTERKKLIIAKLCADGCWVAHYFCLSAYGGMIPNAVGIVRELVFMDREKSAWKNSPLIPVAFILINWGIGAWTFQSPINVLPIVASTLVTVSLWLKNPKLTKILSLPVSVSFLIYDLCVGSWIGVINESFAIVSILLSFIRSILKKEKLFMAKSMFSSDVVTSNQPIVIPREKIQTPAAVIETEVALSCKERGEEFAREIEEKFVSDFEKSQCLFEQGKVDEQDLMAHVSTFVVVKGLLFMSYYANTKNLDENPKDQRLAWFIVRLTI